MELQPSGQTAVSNGQGEFTISGVTPGRYTITISAVGFAVYSNNDLAVTAGGVANVDATLQLGTRSEVVEVRAEREHGEVEAINRERTAENIVQVLPAEIITSLPNAKSQTPSGASLVSRSNAMKAKENTSRFVEPSRVTAM